MNSSVESSSPAPAIHDVLEAPPLTLGQLTWRRFRRHKMAIFGAITLFLLFIYSFGGAFVFSEKYANFTETGARLQAPSSTHPFGTDTVGRDILARLYRCQKDVCWR